MEETDIMKEEKILEILSSIRPEFDFNESSDFIEDGFLDSYDIVSVISAIEDEFGVIIDGLDVIPENFETIDSIVKLIEKSESR